MIVALLEEDNPAVELLDKRIAESPNKEKEEVIVNEGQMLNMLLMIALK